MLRRKVSVVRRMENMVGRVLLNTRVPPHVLGCGRALSRSFRLLVLALRLRLGGSLKWSGFR